MIYRPTSTSLFAVGVALFIQSCARERAGTPVSKVSDSPVLATVAGEPITAADLLAEAERRRVRRQPVPEKDVLLQAMVQRAAMVETAKQAGLDREPEVRRAMEAVLVGELRQRELNAELAAITVSEGELQAAYEATAADYTQAAKARLAILQLTVGKGASETKRAELRARLEGVREQVVANPPKGGRGPAAGGFGAFAIENSDDQVSRYKGGDAGWFELGITGTRWPDAVIAAGQALTPGAFSRVIEEGGDFYLVTKTDARAAATTGIEQATPALRRRLLAEKREAAEAAFLKKVERMANVEFHPEGLAEVEFQASAAARSADSAPPSLPGVRSN